VQHCALYVLGPYLLTDVKKKADAPFVSAERKKLSIFL
jgi:hypothetical protein